MRFAAQREVMTGPEAGTVGSENQREQVPWTSRVQLGTGPILQCSQRKAAGRRALKRIKETRAPDKPESRPGCPKKSL